jgi:hypothetical protein
MKAKVLQFPAAASQIGLRTIYDVIRALAVFSAPLARSHSARLFLNGVLSERQYEQIITEIDQGETNAAR